jgi:hypothetical protein
LVGYSNPTLIALAEMRVRREGGGGWRRGEEEEEEKSVGIAFAGEAVGGI